MGIHDGKVAIITGGALGIGGGASTVLAKEGCKVVIADINKKAGENLVNDINSNGGESIFIEADFNKSSSSQETVNQTVKAFGTVNILFNNVGIQPPASYENAEGTTEEMWDSIININLKSYFLMSKYVIPYMRNEGGGVIVNNASVQGQQSQPLVPAYAASKGGVLSLTRQLALDYAKDKIRVVSVCPGAIDTPMLRIALGGTEQENEELVQDMGKSHPIGRIGLPEDLGNAVSFLCSDKASFITGEFLNVDGGFMALGAWATGMESAGDE